MAAALASAWSLLSVAASPREARAQLVDRRMWVTDDNVACGVRSGDTLYVGGSFHYVGPNTGSFAVLPIGPGGSIARLPRIIGQVFACAGDGAGGWYIGGSFERVGGVARRNLAHVRADGTLDGWNPSPDSLVRDMLRSGSSLFVAGEFSQIGGQPRHRLAELDLATGQTTSWSPEPNAWVHRLALGGDALFASGVFSTIGGQPRSGIARFDLASKNLEPWDPGVDGFVNALEVYGDRLYVGGRFTNVKGTARSGLAAFDLETGALLPWNPNDEHGVVLAIAVFGSRVFVGGAGFFVEDVTRKRLAAFDANSGHRLPWNFEVNGLVTALAVEDSRLYVGGVFTTIGIHSRRNLAAIELGSDQLTSWDTGTDYVPRFLAPQGTSLGVGGAFISAGGSRRNALAAFDLRTGCATSWSPSVEGSVTAMAVKGSAVYVAGLTPVDVTPQRGFLAAFDRVTGETIGWDPGPIPPWTYFGALAVSDSKLYVGGEFASIGGVPRANLAALDLVSAQPTAWNPGADGGVSPLLLVGDTLIVGGDFEHVGGATRRGLAAIHATSGAVLAWGPFVESTGGSWVSTLAAHDSTICVGGYFTSVGGVPRNNVAAVSLTTGMPTSWDPNANGVVLDVEPTETGVFIGGAFTSLGGTPRRNLGVVDAVSGSLLAWDPSTESTVGALFTDGASVLVSRAMTADQQFVTPLFARMLPTDGTAPSTTILSPQGEATLAIGSTQRLEWQAGDDTDVENVDLYLSRNGAAGPWELLAAAVPNRGGYEWPVQGPEANGTAYLWVDARDLAGNLGSDVSNSGFSIRTAPLAVEGDAGGSPMLSTVVPNPVRPSARIAFRTSVEARVRLSVFDVQGRESAVLVDRDLPAGSHVLPFDRRDLRPGLYLVRLRTPQFERTQRMIVLDEKR